MGLYDVKYNHGIIINNVFDVQYTQVMGHLTTPVIIYPDHWFDGPKQHDSDRVAPRLLRLAPSGRRGDDIATAELRAGSKGSQGHAAAKLFLCFNDGVMESSWEFIMII